MLRWSSRAPSLPAATRQCVTTDTRRPELVRICARAMCNLFAGKPGPPISKVRERHTCVCKPVRRNFVAYSVPRPCIVVAQVVAGLPVLTALTRHAEGNVAQDACLALAYFSEGHSDRVQVCVRATVHADAWLAGVPGARQRTQRAVRSRNTSCARARRSSTPAASLVSWSYWRTNPRVYGTGSSVMPWPCLTHAVVCAQLVTPALRCVGNVANGNNAQKQVVLDTNVVPFLATLLDHAKQSVRASRARRFSDTCTLQTWPALAPASDG